MVKWIEEWYTDNCNNDWEHSYGISITTLDNPGWSVEIDLKGTALEKVKFSEIKIERSDDNWVVCSIIENKFVAYGGPRNLGEILEIFKTLAEGI